MEYKPVYIDKTEVPAFFGPIVLAQILGVSRNRAYEIFSLEDFPSRRVGRKLVVEKEQFYSWFNNQIHT